MSRVPVSTPPLSLAGKLRRFAQDLGRGPGYDVNIVDGCAAIELAAQLIENGYLEGRRPTYVVGGPERETVYRSFRLSCGQALAIGTGAHHVELHPSDRLVLDTILTHAECHDQKVEETRLAGLLGGLS